MAAAFRVDWFAMNFSQCLFFAGLGLGASLLRAQSDVPAPPYEAPPALRADAILPAALLTGPHYQVLPGVHTEGGIHRFTIDSDVGAFTADGEEMLLERLREINAIHQLRQISQGEEYRAALKTAAKAPLNLAKDLFTQPKETVQGAAKGAWKMMNRVGESIRGTVNGRQRSPYEESATRDLIGFSKVKRGLAVGLAVDPYSRNETLQKVLDDVAWTSYAGKMTFSAVLLPLGGAAGAVASGAQLGSALGDTIRDNGPADLRLLNQKTLTALAVPPELIQSFLDNPAFSPVHQTLLTQALGSLRGVEGLSVLLELAKAAADEDDARFFQRTAQLIAWLHQGSTPIARLVSLQGFPICLARDGSVAVALNLSYASWNPLTDRFITALLKPQGLTPKGFKVFLSGSVSPLLRQQLEARGIAVIDRLSPALRS